MIVLKPRHLFLALGVLLATALISKPVFAASAYSRDEAREVETEKETQIRSLRNQEINQLRVTLGRREPAKRRADLYFRLAELYIEAYRIEFLLEGRVHEKRLNSGRSDVYIDRSNSKPFLRLGIKACEELLALRINYSRMDSIFYFLAFNHKELGNKKDSVKYYRQLIAKYPESPFVVEAYEELGEDAFARNSYSEANDAFEKAIKHSSGERGAERLPRLLHRISWCQYHLRQLDRAIEVMRRAIEKAKSSDEKFVDLREEALRDMAIFMTEKGNVQAAIDYFKDVAGSKGFYARALEKLGKEYERKAQSDRAVLVYEALLKTEPETEAYFSTLLKLVEIDLKRFKYGVAIERLRKFLPASAPTDDPSVVNLRAMVRRTATESHDRYRKNTKKIDLEVAEQFYLGYLELFLKQNDKRNEKPEIQMYLAEVKRLLGKTSESAQLYRAVLESKDKRYAKEAAAFWVAMLSETLKAQAPSSTKRAEPLPSEKEFVAAADELQELLPHSSEAREADLRAAQLLAGYSSTQKEGRKRAAKIIESDPDTIQGVTAARLWVQVQGDRLLDPQKSKKSDYEDVADDLKEAIAEIRKNSKIIETDRKNGEKLALLLSEYERRLKIGRIALFEKDKDFARAGQAYESFASDPKAAEAQEKAFENSVVSYLRAADYLAAVRVAGTWLVKYPKSKSALDLVRNTATELLILGRYAEAVDLFERVGVNGSSPESLETAARVAEGVNDTSRAVILYKAFLRVYSQSDSRSTIQLALARLLERTGKDVEGAQYLKICAEHSSPVAEECGARLGDLFLRFKDVERAKRNFSLVSAMSGAATKKGKRPTVSPYVGYARYRLAEMTEQGYENSSDLVPLALPPKQLKRAIDQRLKILEDLSKAYLDVVDVGGPWGVAALYRLARWVSRFADEVNKIDPPQKSSPEEVLNFRKNLAALNGSLMSRAIESWNNAYRRSIQFEILSPVLPEILDRLSDLKQKGFVRAQGFRGHFKISGMPANGGKDGFETAIQGVRTKLVTSPKDSQAWVDYGNLLWGDGKPLLASIAYQRAQELNPKNVSAVNNRAVVVLSTEGEEEWLTAAEANLLFQSALEIEPFFLAAKFNRAAVLSYYRLFKSSEALWQQILVKSASDESRAGYAASLQGLTRVQEATSLWNSLLKSDDATIRNLALYHLAAVDALKGKTRECLSRLDDGKNSELFAFEKQSWETLKASCAFAEGQK